MAGGQGGSSNNSATPGGAGGTGYSGQAGTVGIGQGTVGNGDGSGTGGGGGEDGVACGPPAEPLGARGELPRARCRGTGPASWNGRQKSA